jgi:hypothetical protein
MIRLATGTHNIIIWFILVLFKQNHMHLSKVMMGCRKARVTIFDTNKGAMVLITARGHALSLHQDSFAEQRSALGSRIGLSPRLMLKSL